MKKLTAIILAAFAVLTVAGAQEPLTVRVAAPEGIPDGNAAAVLTSNLHQALVLNDAASDDGRYVLQTKASVLSKDVTATAPARFITELEISFFITDPVSGDYLSQTSFSVRGIASGDKASYLDAVKKIKARDPKRRKLITQAREAHNLQKEQQ